METVDLPEKFIERMRGELPENEREAFFAVYSRAGYEKGLLINSLKIDAGEFEKITPLTLDGAVPWNENARYVKNEKVGGDPYHCAGLYYMQEPSAACVAPKAEAKRGERVLDLCAAPGGKTVALAAAMQGEGILVCNEPVRARAQILLSNIERSGVKNAVVLNAYPEEICDYFTEYFDKIVADAPCSGEGMFRKNAEEARREWSEENVSLCAARQQKILDSAAKMLAGGGRLVYSTCTFSREEDEEQTRAFLARHAEFGLISEEKILPHKARGEGHYCAVFEKTSGGRRDLPVQKSNVSRQTQNLIDEFCLKIFGEKKKYCLYENGGAVYALPDNCFSWQKLKILRCGVKLGEIRKNRFEPAHAYALSLKRGEAKNVVSLKYDDARVQKYLRGEEISADGFDGVAGWCAVCADGFPLGWGKAANGVIKNHLPHGLRLFG